MSVEEATRQECPICGKECVDGHELVDHLTDTHDAFTKLVNGEYHE